jgi:hypothetical protein
VGLAASYVSLFRKVVSDRGKQVFDQRLCDTVVIGKIGEDPLWGTSTTLAREINLWVDVLDSVVAGAGRSLN